HTTIVHLSVDDVYGGQFHLVAIPDSATKFPRSAVELPIDKFGKLSGGRWRKLDITNGFTGSGNRFCSCLTVHKGVKPRMVKDKLYWVVQIEYHHSHRRNMSERGCLLSDSCLSQLLVYLIYLVLFLTSRDVVGLKLTTSTTDSAGSSGGMWSEGLEVRRQLASLLSGKKTLQLSSTQSPQVTCAPGSYKCDRTKNCELTA
ncbi:hypothetical protein STEG23_032547, partial [Scotinomys teguina]